VEPRSLEDDVGNRLVVGVLMSRVRVEEKLLLAELERRGVEVVRFDDRELTLDLQDPEPFRRCDVVLERAINHLRALYALRVLNAWGIPTVNTHEVATTCGDKLLTSAALVAAGVATPRTVLAFTPESALAAIESIGYPVVMKPAIGSWGRLLSEGQRPRRGRGDPGAQGHARQLPPRRLLHPGVRPQAGTGHPLIRGRRRDDLRDLPRLAPLDHEHRPGRGGDQLPGHAGARRPVEPGRRGGR
jgi:hypothetical protein